MKLDSNAHSVFSLNYHLMLVIKYRKSNKSGGANIETIRKYIERQGEKHETK